jgi:hypothetical protein
MSNSPTTPKINDKPARRRNARSEQISISVERVEHLTIEVRNAAAITQLLDGIERRLAIVEDELPAVGGLPVQADSRNHIAGNGAA